MVSMGCTWTQELHTSDVKNCSMVSLDQFRVCSMPCRRDYQRMAPEKLTDATMESILWNKVPLELQQELKEIPDGSVQELLQKLLHAETTIQERERRKKRVNQNRSPRTTTHRDNTLAGTLNKTPQRVDSNSATPERNPSQRDTRGQGAEMSLRGVKCFNCRKKGHLAANCPEPPRKN